MLKIDFRLIMESYEKLFPLICDITILMVGMIQHFHFWNINFFFYSGTMPQSFGCQIFSLNIFPSICCNFYQLKWSFSLKLTHRQGGVPPPPSSLKCWHPTPTPPPTSSMLAHPTPLPPPPPNFNIDTPPPTTTTPQHSFVYNFWSLFGLPDHLVSSNSIR